MALLVALFFALLPMPSLANDLYDRAALDRLFSDLASAPDNGTAEQISQRIWRIWLEPKDAALAQRMRMVSVQRLAEDLRGAIATLNAILIDYPDFSEGWNQRATLHYLLGEDEASLSDIARVLVLEPRHFGALSGRAMIHLRRGNRAAALEDITMALKLHPFIASRALFPELPAPDFRI